MSSILSVTCCCAVAAFATSACAEDPAQQAPLPASAAVPAPASTWEGAIGVNGAYRPEYAGSDARVAKLSPVLFLRYGRFTLSNAGGFSTRRANDVERGLGVDMVQGDRVRLNLALRFDAGRSEDTSGALAGLGDIKPTVRLRLNGSWQIDRAWRLGASWSVDAFGRGGGNFGDLSIGHEQRLADLGGLGSTLNLGASLSLAGDRYLQTYYGVSSAQASRSAYAVYEPGSGLRDLALFANLRTELDADWVMQGGVGVSRLLGPAADSPLTRQPDGWGIHLGLARRF